jgi:hypothetical protein
MLRRLFRIETNSATEAQLTAEQKARLQAEQEARIQAEQKKAEQKAKRAELNAEVLKMNMEIQKEFPRPLVITRKTTIEAKEIDKELSARLNEEHLTRENTLKASRLAQEQLKQQLAQGKPPVVSASADEKKINLDKKKQALENMSKNIEINNATLVDNIYNQPSRLMDFNQVENAPPLSRRDISVLSRLSRRPEAQAFVSIVDKGGESYSARQIPLLSSGIFKAAKKPKFGPENRKNPSQQQPVKDAKAAEKYDATPCMSEATLSTTRRFR